MERKQKGRDNAQVCVCVCECVCVGCISLLRMPTCAGDIGVLHLIMGADGSIKRTSVHVAAVYPCRASVCVCVCVCVRCVCVEVCAAESRPSPSSSSLFVSFPFSQKRLQILIMLSYQSLDSGRYEVGSATLSVIANAQHMFLQFVFGQKGND